MFTIETVQRQSPILVASAAPRPMGVIMFAATVWTGVAPLVLQEFMSRSTPLSIGGAMPASVGLFSLSKLGLDPGPDRIPKFT